jgi:hypothetical protein
MENTVQETAGKSFRRRKLPKTKSQPLEVSSKVLKNDRKWSTRIKLKKTTKDSHKPSQKGLQSKIKSKKMGEDLNRTVHEIPEGTESGRGHGQGRGHVPDLKSEQISGYHCKICHKRFFHQSNMYAHQRVHTREKPHNCSFCPYASHTSGYVKMHERVHTGERPFKCRWCSQAFSQGGSRLRHERNVHDGGKWTSLAKLKNV